MLAASSSAAFTAYNMQQPSVGFYRRDSASGMVPALTLQLVGRPDHAPDAAGFNMNKSITKRMANATHYQQVCRQQSPWRFMWQDAALCWSTMTPAHLSSIVQCSIICVLVPPRYDMRKILTYICMHISAAVHDIPTFAWCRSWRSLQRVRLPSMRCAPCKAPQR